MDDVISRRSVIDFINDIEHGALKMSNDNGEDILYRTVLATTKAIRGYCKILPSAQPEIIRCKDCEWWKKQKDSLQGRCELMQMYPTGAWYCGNAQRRVTDG